MDKVTELAKKLRPFLVNVANNIVEQVLGDKILLYHPGNVIATYPVTSAGLTAALAAAVSGDTIKLPGCSITGTTWTIGAGVTVRGMGWGSLLTGAITHSGSLIDVQVAGTITQGAAGAYCLRVLNTTASGNGFVMSAGTLSGCIARITSGGYAYSVTGGRLLGCLATDEGSGAGGIFCDGAQVVMVGCRFGGNNGALVRDAYLITNCQFEGSGAYGFKHDSGSAKVQACSFISVSAYGLEVTASGLTLCDCHWNSISGEANLTYGEGDRAGGNGTEDVLLRWKAGGNNVQDSHLKDGMSGAFLANFAAALTGNHTYTLQDADMTLAALNLAQTFTEVQTVQRAGVINLRSINTAALGAGSGGAFEAATSTTPTAADQRVGAIFFGVEGVDSYQPAAITAYSAEAWNATNRGAYYDFEAAIVGAAARTKILRIRGDYVQLYPSAAFQMLLQPERNANDRRLSFVNSTVTPTGGWEWYASNPAVTVMAVQVNGKAGVGTGSPGARWDVVETDAVTTAVTEVLTVDHESSGTPEAGFGARLAAYLESSTTTRQLAGAIDWLWTTATHATRTADIVFSAVLSGTLGEVWRMTAAGRLDGKKAGITEEGGYYCVLTAGESLSRGEVVQITQGAGGADGKVYKNAIDGDMPIGVVYADASADAAVKIITSGIAYVLPEAGYTATRGYVIYSSDATAGRVDQAASVPAALQHFREIGHWLDTGSGNGAITRAIIHFN